MKDDVRTGKQDIQSFFPFFFLLILYVQRMWPIRGRAAGQGMIFGLSFLNGEYTFIRVCPKQDLNLSYTGYGCTVIWSSLNMGYTVFSNLDRRRYFAGL